MNWKIRNQTLSLEKPLLMGVINVTPDSFSDGGRYDNRDSALSRAERMLEEGVDIFDVGAESTRPNASPVSVQEELDRLLPVVDALRQMTELPISIDTIKPEVAKACLDAGADIINDVSGLKDSGEEMGRVVQSAGAGLILMHRRGTPSTMQSLAQYENTVPEIMGELSECIELARALKISDDSLVIDPGLGFAKTPDQNLEILREVDKFHALGRPVLLGPSRKSFIGHVTGRKVDKREFGTAAVVAYALLKNIQIFRVHEVGCMRDILKIINAIEGVSNVRTF